MTQTSINKYLILSFASIVKLRILLSKSDANLKTLLFIQISCRHHLFSEPFFRMTNELK